MEHKITDNNYITTLCSICGQEVEVNMATGILNGGKTYYTYHCQHCGHIGSIDFNIIRNEWADLDFDTYNERTNPYFKKEIEPEHRTYSLDEILKMNRKENSSELARIANALEDIRDILKRLNKVKL